MADSTTCIFCRIIRGELPSTKRYADDRAIAFDDINPSAPVHILVVPTLHVERLERGPAGREELLGHLLRVAGQIAVEAGIAAGGYRLVINQGADAGQLVDHLHVHVLGGRELGSLT